MRVLIVHSFYQQPGGEDAVVREDLELLRRNGHEVSLFSANNDAISDLWGKLKTFFLVVYNPVARRALAARIRDFRPDVVHVHNFFPLLSPSIFDACIDEGVPAVLTLHNFRILCPTAVLYHGGVIREDSLHGSAWWALKKRVYRNSFFGTLAVACMVEFHKRRGTWRRKVDRFVALSQFGKNKFIDGGLPQDRIVVKPNSRESLATSSGETASRHGALFVGRLSEEKGISLLLRAWEGIEYPIRIVGDGPLSELVRTSADKNSNVEVLGRLDPLAVRKEMERAAFLVMPSLCYEMFGLTIVEAYASGLPVLASRIGGPAEMVDDDVTGKLFEAGDIEDLRDKVRWAIAHPEPLRRMASHVRSVFQSLYSSQQALSTLEAIYRDAVRQRSTSQDRPEAPRPARRARGLR